MNKMILTGLCLTLASASPAPAGDLLSGLGDSLAKAAKQKAESALSRTTSEAVHALYAPGGEGDRDGYDRYGDFWQFRIDEVVQGPDGHWQAVIGVRAAAGHRIGLTASELKVYLISADGETLQNWGELYKAGVLGPSLGLEPLPGTLWLEPGDEARVRVRWDKSRKVQPLKVRLQSTGATGESRTFSMK